jgi:hypothetical protein
MPWYFEQKTKTKAAFTCKKIRGFGRIFVYNHFVPNFNYKIADFCWQKR